MPKDEHPYPWRREMTHATAKQILAAPLRFADAHQIEAKLYLDALDGARMRLMHCKQCGGEGTVRSKRNPNASVCQCVGTEAPEIRRDLGVGVKRRPYLVG